MLIDIIAFCFGFVMLDLVVVGRFLRFVGGEVVVEEGCIGCKFGKIVVLSSSPSDFRDLIGSGTVVVRVDDRYLIVPGFVDSHCHLAEVARVGRWCCLRGCRSVSEVLSRLSRCGRYGGWVVGFGWDQEVLGEFITRDVLDEVFPDVPVCLIRVCGHVAVLNRRGLELTRVHEKFPSYVDVDTGAVRECAVDYVRKFIASQLGADQIAEELSSAVCEFLRYGVTTCAYMSVDLPTLSALFLSDVVSKLPIRVFVYLEPDAATKLTELGLPPLWGTDRVRVYGVKFLLDGSFGARTALLREPYSDSPSDYGTMYMDLSEFEELVKRFSSCGWQIATHAIGDKAIEYVIDTYRRVGVMASRTELRHRIEHSSLTPPDLLNAISVLRPVLCVQPQFILSDFWIVDRLGITRSRWVYALRSLLSTGAPVVASSDAPVELQNPLLGIYAAVSRGRYEGLRLFEVSSDEVLDVVSALKLYTISGESVYRVPVGNIDVGYLADMVVLSRDVSRLSDLRELKSTEVLMTITGGEIVYEREVKGIEVKRGHLN